MTQTPTQPNVPCSKCSKSIHWLEVFPENLCLDCYEIKMSNVPIEQFGQQIIAGFQGGILK